MKRWRGVLWLALPVVMAGALLLWQLRSPPQGDPAADQQRYRYTEVDCWFRPPRDAEVRCGRLHTAPETGRFALPVVILRSDSDRRQPDPILYLPGGPGGSAWLDGNGIRHWWDWLYAADADRDLVMLDMRGVGFSDPALRCARLELFSRRILGRNASVLEELEEGDAIIRECFEQTPDFDPAHFGTWISARDVVELMAALDYERWNLLGVSYGSRLALAVALESPGQVRSLVLDSVYPLDRGGLQTFPAEAAAAVERFLAWCASRSECDGGDDLPDLLPRALRQLQAAPVTLRVKRWNWEPSLTVVVNDHRFLGAVFSGIYDTYTWPTIARAMRGVLAGETEALNELMEPYVNNALSPDFNSLVFSAVDCRDHPPGSEEDFLAALTRTPWIEPYMRDLWRYQSCHALALDEEPRQIDELPAIPALLLAGELDPVTPAYWAEELHRHWPHSQLYISRDRGHGITNSDACAHDNLRHFLSDPEQPWLWCDAE